jgi:hypothetical protein
MGIRTDDAAYFRQTKKLNMATKTKKAATKKSSKAAPPKQPKTRRAKQTMIKGATAKPAAKDKTGQIIMTTLAVGVAGVAGYFGWQYMKKRMATRNDADISITDTDFVTPVIKPVKPIKETPTPSPGSYTKSRNDDFPLKKGSKGDRVRTLQQALIDKYGSSALPKYGADSDFGTETANALKKYGIPIPVTESAFNLLTQAGGNVGNAAGIANKLHAAASNKNFDSVLSLLKNIRNKQDYQQVGNSFLQLRLRGVRQTLVNGLLSSFDNAEQKQKIGMEFVRMGLQYNGSKWSLAGFDGQPVVTTEPATVWISSAQSLQVPAMMVLGNEVTRRLDYTLFENNNKYFLVKTQSIKYL